MDYYHISAQELGKGAKLPILKLGDSGEVFYEMAAEMCAAIRANNAAGKPTVFICPVGPVGQYPIFVRLVNREQLSLRNCWFINMDEYLTDDGQWIAEENPLSFRGFTDEVFFLYYNMRQRDTSCDKRSVPEGEVWNSSIRYIQFHQCIMNILVF